MFKLDLEEEQEPETKLPKSIGSSKSKRVPKKHLLLLFCLCQCLSLCGSQQTVESLKRWEYQTTLAASWKTCLQVKKQVRTGHGTMNWFQIGKGVLQGYILSPCLFNLYAEYIMRNPGLDVAQAEIKIARRNINNLRYADDTTLTAESEELKSLDESEIREWKS